MKTIRKIYGNFDRMIADDKFYGWMSTILCHYWVLLAIGYITIWYDPIIAILWAGVSFMTYTRNVTQLDLREARAELARLKADHRI